MNIIVNVDKRWQIGRNNELLFSIPEDLKYFKEKTIGKTVVMGKNTLLSLPDSKPLPDRKNIVISTTYNGEGVTVFRSLDDFLINLENSKDVFVIGGESIYKLLLPYCHTAYVTKVDSFRNGNKVFPNLDTLPDWKLIETSTERQHGGFSFYFTKYVNYRPLI